MTVYCSKCGKKLGILAAKYKSKEGSVMCASCLEKQKMEQKEVLRKQKEKNRELQKQEEQERQEELRKQKEKNRELQKQEEQERQEELRKQKEKNRELQKQEEQERQEELRKQKEKNREIMMDLISKYLTNKDPHTIFLIMLICCNAYYIETYGSRSKEIKHDTPRDINNFILGKVVKERPECVDSVKILIDTPGTLDISYDVIRTLRTLSEYRNPLYLPKSSKMPGLSSSELDEFGEDIKTIAFGQPKEVSGKSLPQSFKGSGDDVIGPIELKRGSVKFDCTHESDNNFIIELYESNGEDSELIVNEIGPYTGKRLEEIRTSDNYYISVVGNGWTIKLTQEITVDPAPTQTPTPTTETISRKIWYPLQIKG